MTTTFISQAVLGAGPLHVFADESDALVILSGGGLLATSGSPFDGTDFDNLDILVQGQLFSSQFHTWNGQGLAFSVAQGGTVTSTVSGPANSFLYFQAGNCEIVNDGTILANRSTAIASGGGNVVSNYGKIQGQTGVSLGVLVNEADVLINGGIIQANTLTAFASQFGHAVKVGAAGSRVINLETGHILADGSAGAGIYLVAQAGGTLIRNLGAIDAVGGFGISFALLAAAAPTATLMNRGEVSGGAGAFNGSDNADSVVNRGLLTGAVFAKAGDDTLDNRDGMIVGQVDLGDGNDAVNNRAGQIDGMVLGGLGDDVFVASATGEDWFDGGLGTDTVDFRLGPAVVLALDGSLTNSGAALNDEFSGIEIIYGSRSGADQLRGNSASNQLFGEGGVDRLDGAAGSDSLAGGRGADRLVGGLGNDTFIYSHLDQIGDIITDFGAVLGNNDRFQIAAAAFGGGLAVGALNAAQFQTRADSVAQDADDRFIFRTTNQTLWFDADGNGAGAAVLLADLQAGAVVTAADIFLI